MISEFQKLIYKICCIAPICIFLAITLYIQRLNIIFCILLGAAGIGGCVYAIVFIRLCGNNLPMLKISVENISLNDTSVLVYIVTYMLPLVGVAWEDTLLVWLLIAAGIIALGIKMSNLAFCPILLLAGYHCYKANLSTGTECILISRRKGVRNSKQIKQAIYISETLMLDETGGKENV